MSVTTIAGYVQVSQQLLDLATVRFGYVNHRRNPSQRSRRRAYRTLPTAALFLTHVKVPNRWPEDWRARTSRRIFGY